MENNDFIRLKKELTKIVQYIPPNMQDDYLNLVDQLNNLNYNETSNKVLQREYYSLDEICTIYKLPKSNIKDRTWRIKHHFPLGNMTPGCSLRFRGIDVETWCLESKKKGK